MSTLIEMLTELFHLLSTLLTELYSQTKALLTELFHLLSTLFAELFYHAKTLLTELFHVVPTLLSELIHHPSTLRERLMELLHEGYSQYLTWYHGGDILTQYLVLAIMAASLFLLWVIVILSRLTK